MERKQIIGTACAQSSLEGFAPQNALEPGAERCWKAAPYYRWWMMDCGSICRIESVTVQTGLPQGEFYRYAIDYSLDRINWTQLCEKTDDRECPAAGEYYAVEIKARYLRITITFCSSGDVVSLQNVTVIGEPCAEPERKPLTEARVRVVECARQEGFLSEKTGELEPGWVDTMLCCNNNAWLAFHGVDLRELCSHQLCGMYDLAEKDRALHVCLEVRLDSPEGRCIGSMNVTRQYTPWLQFACDLEPGDYGIRDLYLCVTRIDAPQKLGILWLRIKKRPILRTEIIDHADEAVPTDGPFQVFFGNLHCHTGFSDGVRTPAYAYDYARYRAGLDFLGITEHSNLLDDAFDATLSRKWRDLKRFAEEKTEPGKFLALMGSETTWYNQFGHMNIYGADFFLNPYEVKYNDTAEYYRTLKQFPRVINQWNHPWSCGNRHLDMFEPYDAELDKVMYTIEINSIEVPEEKSLMYYIHALDQGWHVSPVGSQDNHHEDWGTENDIRTGVVVRRLTKADFYDAIRRHRTYYSSARRLRVLFCANGHLMGATIPKTEKVIFDIAAQNLDADAELERVEIIGEGGSVLYTHFLMGYEAKLSLSVTEPGPYCFLKVRLKNGKFAATAPVWIEK